MVNNQWKYTQKSCYCIIAFRLELARLWHFCCLHLSTWMDNHRMCFRNALISYNIEKKKRWWNIWIIFQLFLVLVNLVQVLMSWYCPQLENWLYKLKLKSVNFIIKELKGESCYCFCCYFCIWPVQHSFPSGKNPVSLVTASVVTSVFDQFSIHLLLGRTLWVLLLLLLLLLYLTSSIVRKLRSEFVKFIHNLFLISKYWLNMNFFQNFHELSLSLSHLAVFP